jgi:hypothetical protein
MGPSVYALPTNFVFLRFSASYCGVASSLGIFGKGLRPWLGRIAAIFFIRNAEQCVSPAQGPVIPGLRGCLIKP